MQKERKKRERKDQLFAEVTLQKVADMYNVDRDKMVSKSRNKLYVQSRKTAQFILHKGTDFSLLQISKTVGRTDHSTAINSIRTVETRIEFDEEFKERVEELFATINKQVEGSMKGNGISEPIFAALTSE